MQCLTVPRACAQGKPPLSPLPSPRHSPLPRSRRVSSAHSIYISPLKQSPMRLTDRAGTVRSYSFNRSPAHVSRTEPERAKHGWRVAICSEVLDQFQEC